MIKLNKITIFLMLTLLFFAFSVSASDFSASTVQSIGVCACATVENNLDILSLEGETITSYVGDKAVSEHLPSTYRISYSGEAADWVVSFPNEVSLLPAEKESVKRYITVPCDVDAGTYDLITTISADGIEKQVTQHIKVSECVNMEISAEVYANKACPAEMVTYQYKIKNTQSYEDVYYVSLKGLEATLSEEAVVVQPYSEKDLFIYVVPQPGEHGQLEGELTIETKNSEVIGETKLLLEVPDECYDFTIESGELFETGLNETEFSLKDDEYQICESEEWTMPVLVTNKGRAGDEYDIEFVGPEFAEAEGIESVLEKNEAELFLVDVIVPEYNEGEYEFIVEVENDVGIEKEAIIPVRVDNCYHPEFVYQEKAKIEYAGGALIVRVINTGVKDAEYALSIMDEEGLVPEWLEFSDTVKVKAGEEKEVEIGLIPTEEIETGKYEYVMGFVADNGVEYNAPFVIKLRKAGFVTDTFDFIATFKWYILIVLVLVYVLFKLFKKKGSEDDYEAESNEYSEKLVEEIGGERKKKWWKFFIVLAVLLSALVAFNYFVWFADDGVNETVVDEGDEEQETVDGNETEEASDEETADTEEKIGLSKYWLLLLLLLLPILFMFRKKKTNEALFGDENTLFPEEKKADKVKTKKAEKAKSVKKVDKKVEKKVLEIEVEKGSSIWKPLLLFLLLIIIVAGSIGGLYYFMPEKVWQFGTDLDMPKSEGGVPQPEPVYEEKLYTKDELLSIMPNLGYDEKGRVVDTRTGRRLSDEEFVKHLETYRSTIMSDTSITQEELDAIITELGFRPSSIRAYQYEIDEFLLALDEYGKYGYDDKGRIINTFTEEYVDLGVFAIEVLEKIDDIMLYAEMQQDQVGAKLLALDLPAEKQHEVLDLFDCDKRWLQDTTMTIDLSKSISDPDGDVLTFGVEGGEPLNVRFYEGIAEITPPRGYSGVSYLHYTVDDGSGVITSDAKTYCIEKVDSDPLMITIANTLEKAFFKYLLYFIIAALILIIALVLIMYHEPILEFLEEEDSRKNYKKK